MSVLVLYFLCINPKLYKINIIPIRINVTTFAIDRCSGKPKIIGGKPNKRRSTPQRKPKILKAIFMYTSISNTSNSAISISTSLKTQSASTNNSHTCIKSSKLAQSLKLPLRGLIILCSRARLSRHCTITV